MSVPQARVDRGPSDPEPRVAPSAARTLERVRAALEELPHEVRPTRDDVACLAVQRADLHRVLRRLRDAAGFDACTFVTAVDRYPDEPRFELVHQLLSLGQRDRVRVVCALPGDDPSAPSATDLWPGAAFAERGCWDLFGIRFEGLANHGRLYMPEGYDHHPLRKDFPHEGIEPDRLYREWDERRRREWDPTRAPSRD